MLFGEFLQGYIAAGFHFCLCSLGNRHRNLFFG